MRLCCSDKITFNERDISRAHLAQLKKALTLPNPMFFKLQKMGKATWGTPSEYRYYSAEDGVVSVPRGCRSRVIEFLQTCGYDVECEDTCVQKKVWGLYKKNDLMLRDYQVDLVEKVLASREGMLVAGTGTGKTVMAAEVIRRLGLTATILVHNNVLLGQFRNTFRQFFGYDVGVINGKSKKVKGITVATFQSLFANEIMMDELVPNTSVLVVDECHSAVTQKRLKVISRFKPYYLYGLTATPARSASDGRTKAIEIIFGKKIVEYHQEQMKPVVDVKRSGVKVPVDEYHLMVEALVNHESRNTLISGITLGEAFSGRKVLVLTKRVAHYKALRERLGGKNRMFIEINSDDPNRDVLLDRLRNGDREFMVLFGTTSLLATGTDIPSLDTLVLACDMKEHTLTEQAIGRIMRLFEGKPQPKIYDIWDDKCPIFREQFYHRKRLYKKKGWEVLM